MQAILLPLIDCFFITWAFERLFSLNTGNIITAVIFVVSYVFIKHTKSIIDSDNKKSRQCARLMGALFALIFIIYDNETITADLSNKLFRTIILLAVFVGLYRGFYYIMQYIYAGMLKEGTKSLIYSDKEFRLKHIGIICFVLCIIGYLPYFLYQYPGIMTPDSINQFEQALGMIEYSNHHPFIHTLIIKLCYNIGYIFTKDVTAAAAFYTIAQMCFMSFVASYVVITLKKGKINEKICIAVMLFYAFVPYNAVYAITVWKDVPFAGLTAILVCSLIRIDISLVKLKEKVRYQDILAFVLSAFGFCTFRANAFYAFIVLIFVLVLKYIKVYKAIIVMSIAVLFSVVIFKGPVMKGLNVSQTDFIESVAIPLQQIVSVIVNDRAIQEEDMKEITNVIDTTYIKELYAPGCADNMKELVRAGNENYLVANKGKFLKIYIKLGFNYPGDYIKAYAGQTHGFVFPDRCYGLADTEGVIASDTGIYSKPLIAGPIVVKTKEILIKLSDMIPLYGIIWSMGAIFWILLIAISVCYVGERYNNILYLIPQLLLMLTLLIATPLAEEYRYSFFLITTLPIILLSAYIDVNDRSVL